MFCTLVDITSDITRTNSVTFYTICLTANRHVICEHASVLLSTNKTLYVALHQVFSTFEKGWEASGKSEGESSKN